MPTFSRDVLGRYVCNTFDEATASGQFDLIVVGGGTFGVAVAEHLWFRGMGRAHRILVVEGGPFLLPEHVQNLPVLRLDPAGATTINQLRQDNQFGIDKPRAEVWGLPWQSAIGFPGLAYCVGGRSLYWGGWSPELLDAETPTSRWPVAVLDDLRTAALADGSPGYFRQASDQIGVTETNDFIFGELHLALRQQLYAGVGGVTDVILPGALPDHPAVRFSPSPVTKGDVAALMGLKAAPASRSKQDMQDELKLEAPLAVQGRPGHAGFFPFNKFSAVPLLIKAARDAWAESGGDDAKKRLMVVPSCHVNRLVPVPDGGAWRVGAIETNLGPVTVPADGKVIVALGTIESTRLIRASFDTALPADALDRIGRNLLAHLRSNIDIRIPREALASLAPTARSLEASALFVKGRHQYSGTTEFGHFHLQITASGLGAAGANSEAELFKKIPDLDTLEAQRHADDSHVVVTIRGIGEMEPMNPGSRVTLDQNSAEEEFGVRRAYVGIVPSARDLELWQAMDRASDDVARIFAAGHKVDLIVKGNVRVSGVDTADLATLLPSTLPDGKNNPDRRDGLGTTHHEAGTLWMGDDTTGPSVTDAQGRLRGIANTYVLAPALFPTIGSPNPMLTGIALARRLGDHLMPTAPAARAQAGFRYLFDGTPAHFRQWKFVGVGGVALVNRALVAQPGSDIGLLYYEPEQFANFILRLDFLLCHPRGDHNDNSGVFVRFRNPQLPVPDRTNLGVSHPYINQAYVPVDTGFEIQIDEEARGDRRLGEPDGLFYHRTGAIYKVKERGPAPGQQNYRPAPPLAGDTWHQYEIEANSDSYIVRLNGDETTRFTHKGDPVRGNPPAVDPASGYIGIQCHTGTVTFANIRVSTV